MSLPRLARLAAPLLLMTTAALSAGAARAENPPTPGEKMLKYRKALYQVISWNVGPLGAMAQDKKPYDAAEFALRATRVAELTPMLSESYGPESEGVAGSKLKAAAWKNRADFDAKLKALVERSAALARIAGSGDAAKSKAAFFDLADACKACHDKYKDD